MAALVVMTALVVLLAAALAAPAAAQPRPGRPGTRPYLSRANPVAVPPSSAALPRIINGQPVSEADEAFGARFMVKLLLPRGATDFSYYCAGSLVSRNKVVTAAHCVSGFDTSNDIVRIGGLTLTDGFQRNIERTDIHPDFNFATFACDFAVITVANPPTDEEYERAGVVYARLNFNPAWPSLGKTVTLTGWGSVDGGSLVASPVLRVTSFRRDRFRTCANYLQDNNLPVVGLNVKTMICFSLADNTASCGGDSGAPVWRFFEKPGFRSYWRIYGVVSFGYQDPTNATDVCPPGGPDYYARLSVAEAWFQTVL